MPVDRKDWQWLGHPAHFCAAEDCRFHMTTIVGCVVVSTVGDYRSKMDFIMGTRPDGDPDRTWWEEHKKRARELGMRHSSGAECIGYLRFYETMVFRVEGFCEDPDCDCGHLPNISGHCLDDGFEGYQTALDAQIGPVEMCERFAADEAQRLAANPINAPGTEGTDANPA